MFRINPMNSNPMAVLAAKTAQPKPNVNAPKPAFGLETTSFMAKPKPITPAKVGTTRPPGQRLNILA